MEGDVIITQDLMKYEMLGEDANGKIIGRIARPALAVRTSGTAALGYGVLYSRIEVERKAESRVKRVKAAETDRSKASAARDRLNEANKRRKSVQDSLKTLEEKNKENDRRKSPAVKDRIAQAG
jgi:Flp pilus assembly protein TadB